MWVYKFEVLCQQPIQLRHLSLLLIVFTCEFTEIYREMVITKSFRYLRLIIIAALVIPVAGCYTVNEKIAAGKPSVANGYTKSQVIASVGNPKDTQFNGGIEVWRYCSTGMFNDDYLTVVFRDGEVIGKETYTNTRGGDCTRFFKQIYWSKYVKAAPARQQSPRKSESTSKVSTGTGFFINRNGHIVTNHHVIDSCGSIYVKEFGPARVIASDKNNDIAILKVNSGPSIFAKIRGTQKVNLGETVAVYGFPYTGTLSQDGNLTEGNVSALSGLENDIRMFQISAPVQPGNSGGPLLDSSMNVIGVVTAKLNAIAVAKATGDIPQNVNFAVKSDILKSVLEVNGITFNQANLSTPNNLVEIAKKARKFTSLIVCR
jgi:S1-C subfamily serine protease